MALTLGCRVPITMLDFLKEISGFVKELVVFRSTFTGAGLRAIGAKGYVVTGNGVKKDSAHGFAFIGGKMRRGHEGSPLAYGSQGALET